MEETYAQIEVEEIGSILGLVDTQSLMEEINGEE